MSTTILPVYMTAENGELVRVGTATLLDDRSGFVLQLGKVITGNKSVAPASNGGAVFPNYGRSKGMPISGAPENELRYYGGGAQRSLGDPAKARFHDRERALLQAINAELSGRGLATLDEPEPGQAPESDLPI